MDIASISAALGSIKAATDIAKLIMESGSTLEKAEAKLQLAELISALADVKIEISQIQQILIDKDGEIRTLKAAVSLKEDVLWDAPYYWRKVDDGRDGPYCQQCYDKDNMLIRLLVGSPGCWSCRTCRNRYKDSSYKPTEARKYAGSHWTGR